MTWVHIWQSEKWFLLFTKSWKPTLSEDFDADSSNIEEVCAAVDSYIWYTDYCFLLKKISDFLLFIIERKLINGNVKLYQAKQCTREIKLNNVKNMFLAFCILRLCDYSANFFGLVQFSYLKFIVFYANYKCPLDVVLWL